MTFVLKPSLTSPGQPYMSFSLLFLRIVWITSLRDWSSCAFQWDGTLPGARALPFYACIQKWYRGIYQLGHQPHMPSSSVLGHDGWVQPAAITSASSYQTLTYHLLNKLRDSMDERINGWTDEWMIVSLIQVHRITNFSVSGKGCFSNFEILSHIYQSLTTETWKSSFQMFYSDPI